MKRYLITNPCFEGEVEVIYNQNNKLYRIDFSNAVIDAESTMSLKRTVPATDTDIQLCFSSQTIIVESAIVITFEMFYNKYDHKFNRDRCEKLFERLSKTDKILAFFNLAKYERYLRKNPTQAKMHPDTYLRNKAWLNAY